MQRCKEADAWMQRSSMSSRGPTGSGRRAPTVRLSENGRDFEGYRWGLAAGAQRCQGRGLRLHQLRRVGPQPNPPLIQLEAFIWRALNDKNENPSEQKQKKKTKASKFYALEIKFMTRVCSWRVCTWWHSICKQNFLYGEAGLGLELLLFYLVVAKNEAWIVSDLSTNWNFNQWN